MLWAAACGALAGAMLIFPDTAAEAARQGLFLWAHAVAPTLGPFMACMLMLSSRLGGGLWPRVVMGWLCGSPGSARLLLSAKPQGRAALRCAALTGTMSPMFFLGTADGWLGGGGMAVLVCHLLGALLMGLCIPADMKAAAPADPLPLHAALRDSAAALLLIGSCMMLGCVSAALTARALPFLSRELTAALQCGLEVTAGVKALIALGGPLTLPLACAACSFGGLSLLMQNAAFWQESGVGMGRLFLLRLIHGVVSGALCYALTCMLY